MKKKQNISVWKGGINNIKNANSADYAKDKRKGIRF